MTSAPLSAVLAWLEAFAAAVRDEDLVAGRALFAREASGFGTVTDTYDGLDDLVARQWSDVWPRTSGFAFRPESVRVWGDSDHATVAVEWASVGTRTDGSTWERSGRATFALQRAEGPWRAQHSHVSMTPGTPA